MSLRLMSEIICSTWNSLFESACVRADRLLLRSQFCAGECKNVIRTASMALGSKIYALFIQRTRRCFTCARPCEINNSLYFDTLCRGKRARGGYWWWINYYMRWAKLWTRQCLLFGESAVSNWIIYFWAVCCGTSDKICVFLFVFNCSTNTFSVYINRMPYFYKLPWWYDMMSCLWKVIFELLKKISSRLTFITNVDVVFCDCCEKHYYYFLEGCYCHSISRSRSTRRGPIQQAKRNRFLVMSLLRRKKACYMSITKID